MAHAPAPVYQVWDKEQRRMVMRGRPFFRVFRHGHLYPAVSDRDLDKLRLAERQGRPIEHVRIFKPGEAVRLGAGSGFEGLIGEISEVKGNYAFVRFSLFGAHPTVKVNARSLLSAA
jgi:transcription antitermination factor NusG